MWVKICGVREPETAQAVAQAGADAIGLNFFSRSPRCVSPTVAAEIVHSVGRQLACVGLFVNHTAEEIEQILRQAPLSWLQFHGDESPEFLVRFKDRKLIKAFRGLSEVGDYLQQCHKLGVSLAACLIDAAVPGSYGGTGQRADWPAVRAGYQTADWPPLILAGGLTQENVHEAIQAVNPWGVDTASGVESAPGIKAAVRIQEFVQQAKRQD